MKTIPRVCAVILAVIVSQVTFAQQDGVATRQTGDEDDYYVPHHTS